MSILSVTPDTFQAALDTCSAGDVLQLQAGTYSEVYTLAERAGTQDEPIVIEADPALDPGQVTVSQGMEAETYRPIANKIARARYDAGKYPGLWDEAPDARLRLDRCAHILVRNLTFEMSWPTHIYTDAVQNVTIQDCRFLDATFCIVANGRETRDLIVERCTWMQDRVPGRIWSGIAWKRIHGHPEHETCPWAVRLDDFRLFDGDFLRTTNILGGVTVRHCTVENAFNGVHAEGDGDSRRTNRDFHIHDCQFIEIRDNAIEPEDAACNWSVHDNLFLDNHAPFSFACKDLSHIYLFANVVAFRSVQGSSGATLLDKDCNRGGKVFKLKGVPDAPHGPNYIFNNSMITRLKYLPKGIFEGLRHFNNALQFVPSAGSGFDSYPTFFGNPDKDPPKKRFTDAWSDRGYSIEMDGDVVLLPGWPVAPKDVGYTIGPNAVGADPGFARSDFSGPATTFADFATAPDGPCRRAGIAMSVVQPNGDVFQVAAGADVGAMQRDPKTGALSVFKGPPFQSTLTKTTA